MDKRYAIFDMDGTLVDSMRYWKHLAGEYLERKGVRRIPPGLMEQIKPTTLTESAALFAEEFRLAGTPEELSAEMNALMAEHYQRDIPLKAGVREYLGALSEAGVTMCVASATAEPLMAACLGRLGVLERFAFLLSCETVGAGKNRPDVYLAAAERLGCTPSEAAVYEDALYAAETARAAGFHVVGVWDASAGRNWERMKALADEVITEYREELR